MLFKTVQDCLVNELRLAGIATIEAVNRFMEEWLPIYNRRFAVPLAQAADLHRPKSAGGDLNTSCASRPHGACAVTGRAPHGHLYQVRSTVRATHVIVEDWVDGTMRVTHKGRPLTYQAIVARPLRVPPLPRSRSRSARSRRHARIRGASACCRTEQDTRRQVSHKPDMSTMGKRGHF